MRHFRDNVLRVVAVLGLVVVLLLGAWGIIQLAFWLPSLFGNISDNIGGIFRRAPAEETLTLSLPMSVASGSEFTINFSNRNATGARTFGLAYQCRDNVAFDVTLPGKTAQTIECDTPFKLEGATSSVKVTPRLTGKEATQVGVSMAVLDSAGTIMATSTGGTTVTAAAAATTTKPATTKPTTTKPAAKPASTYYPSGRTQNLYGYADLEISNVTAYAQGSHATVQFTVRNAGTNVAGANWHISANLPIAGGYTYTSPAQQTLYPGDYIVYTMGYDDLGSGYGYNDSYCPPTYGGVVPPCYVTTPGSYGYGSYGGGERSVTLHVDPYNRVLEQNEYNNTTSRSYYGY